MQKLTKEFFARKTQEVAPDLLGKILVHELPEGLVAGRIVETESYHQDDPAAHSYGGISPRNKSLFAAPGTIYVYLSYGLHYCANVATYTEGIGEGVLLRALEPLSGLEVMRQRRQQKRLELLCSGPARLTQALGIDKSHDGQSLFSSQLYVAEDEDSKLVTEEEIVFTTRVGISKAVEEKLRFYIRNNRFISRK